MAIRPGLSKRWGLFVASSFVHLCGNAPRGPGSHKGSGLAAPGSEVVMGAGVGVEASLAGRAGVGEGRRRGGGAVQQRWRASSRMSCARASARSASRARSASAWSWWPIQRTPARSTAWIPGTEASWSATRSTRSGSTPSMRRRQTSRATQSTLRMAMLMANPMTGSASRQPPASRRGPEPRRGGQPVDAGVGRRPPGRRSRCAVRHGSGTPRLLRCPRSPRAPPPPPSLPGECRGDRSSARWPAAAITADNAITATTQTPARSSARP